MDISIRRATHDDYEGVAAFTSELWADRGGDYLPDVYHDWLEEEDADDRKTFLAEASDPGAASDGSETDVAGILQAVMLSEDEAWYQGMRVNPAYRGRGVASRLNEAAFDWSRERGATVGRVMTFSWNAPALGLTRAIGFDPVTEFRWAHVEPDAGGGSSGAGGDSSGAGGDSSGAGGGSSDASDGTSYAVVPDPVAAWRYWTHSDARDGFRGLALDDAESWAVRELARADLSRLADETAVFAVRGSADDSDDAESAGTGTRRALAGISYRTRTFQRESDNGEELTWAEYGVGAWADVDAARTLFGAIARDAAAVGADRTRIAIPETAAFVSDAVAAGADVSENPCFVLTYDL